MACHVLPPRSGHPLAAILLPHNGLLVGRGGKNDQWALEEKQETSVDGEIEGQSKGGRRRWRKPSPAGPSTGVTLVMICRLVFFSLFFFMSRLRPLPFHPSGLWEVFIFLMSCWVSFFSLYLIRSGWEVAFVILSSQCLHLVCACGCVDCCRVKWCKVFMPRFWLALVEEVDSWVRVVWHRCPGLRVLPALSICSDVGGLHLTWLL